MRSVNGPGELAAIVPHRVGYYLDDGGTVALLVRGGKWGATAVFGPEGNTHQEAARAVIDTLAKGHERDAQAVLLAYGPEAKERLAHLVVTNHQLGSPVDLAPVGVAVTNNHDYEVIDLANGQVEEAEELPVPTPSIEEVTYGYWHLEPLASRKQLDASVEPVAEPAPAADPTYASTVAKISPKERVEAAVAILQDIGQGTAEPAAPHQLGHLVATSHDVRDAVFGEVIKNAELRAPALSAWRQMDVNAAGRDDMGAIAVSGMQLDGARSYLRETVLDARTDRGHSLSTLLASMEQELPRPKEIIDFYSSLSAQLPGVIDEAQRTWERQQAREANFPKGRQQAQPPQRGPENLPKNDGNTRDRDTGPEL